MNTRLTSKMRLELIGWLVFLTILAFIDYFDLYFFFLSGSQRRSMLVQLKKKSAKLLNFKKSLILMFLFMENQRSALFS